MSKALVTSKDMASHKLIVKLEDGSFRTFYLNPRQATFIAQNINSVEPFLVLPEDIDPDSPTFYPKRSAWMERLSEDDRDALVRRTLRNVPVDDGAEAKKAAHSKAIREWIEANPKRFDELLLEAEKGLSAGKGIFNLASKNVKRNLIRFEAMRYVSNLLTTKS